MIDDLIFVQPRVGKRELANGSNADVMTKQQSRVQGLQWAAFKQGAVYSGHLPEGMGYFSYQLEGQKLLAIADVVELLEEVKPGVHKWLMMDEHEARSAPLSAEAAIAALRDQLLLFIVIVTVYCFLVCITSLGNVQHGPYQKFIILKLKPFRYVLNMFKTQ